jgi:hypothetical protein
MAGHFTADTTTQQRLDKYLNPNSHSYPQPPRLAAWGTRAGIRTAKLVHWITDFCFHGGSQVVLMSLLGLGSAADVSEVPASSIFRVEVCRLSGYSSTHDRLCGLVVRVPGYRSRGPGYDFRRYQIFWVVVGLERGPLSLVRIIEELLERKVATPV